MNKRLKSLYEQAHSIRYYDGDPALEGNPPTVYWQGEASAEKFAELIIKECLAQVDKISDALDADHEHKEALGAEWAGMAIARHFGIG